MAVIAVYPNDHPPPHVHALFAEDRATIDIGSLTVVRGFLPIAKRRRVLAWVAERQAVLRDRFEKAVNHEQVEPIE